MRIVGCFFSLLFIFIASGAVGQDLIKSRHETDDQKSVDVEFDTAPETALTTASFSVIVNGVPMTIIAVTPVSSPSYRITFTAPLPVDPDPVIVTYLPNGSTIISENNRLLTCSDFEWETNTRPTPSCAPVDPINKMVFSIKPGARNSSNFNFSEIESRISWNDPQNTISTITAYESGESGNKTSGTNFMTFDADLDNFNYPGDENDCFYTSEWKVYITGVGSCSSTDPNQFVTYTSHNVDDKGNGQLIINPTVANADQVCLNDEADVQFIDGSNLNCTDGAEPLNNEGRWVRIIYGDPSRGAGERIPNVHIKGIPVTDDKGALINPLGAGGLTLTAEGIIYVGKKADIFGVKFFPSPVDGPVGNFLPITTKSTAAGLANREPGDQFTVRIQYWNICNPYDNIGNISHNEVSRTRKITIIDIPNPPVADPIEICTGAAVGNFSLVDSANNTEIRWYSKDPKSGGKLIVNSLGKHSTELPADGIVDNTTPGIYSVWATSITGANSCESDAVETFITVRDPLSQPNEITGTSTICNGTNNISFKVPDAEGASVYGGDWEYLWTHAGGGGVTFNKNTGQSVSVNFNINSIAGDFTTRTIKVVKQYKDASPVCTGETRTYKITIYNPSQGGSVSSDNNICEGGSTGILTLSGYRGKVLKWQRQDDGGSYNDIAGTAGMDSYSETLSVAGEYKYRAVVLNGTCDPAFSAPSTITVNSVPQKPVITEANSFITCADGGEIRLKSSNAAAIGKIFTWYKTSDLLNPVQSGASDELVLNDVAQAGKYVVKVTGASPTNCESELSDSVTVTINSQPSATASGGGSVCSGNPAPDIVWQLTGAAPYDFRISVTGQPDIVESNYNSDTYTITAPQPETTTDYEMISLSDASNCSPVSLGGVVSVTIGGTAPVFENATPSVGPAVCDNGSTTDVPAITLDLDLQDTYKLIYNINGDANQSVIFTTDAAGVFVLQPDYNAAPFNSTPGIYVFNLVSISNTTTGCLTPVNQSLNVVINTSPDAPSGPQDVIVCSDSEAGGLLTVDDPGLDFTVRWFTNYTSPSLNTPVSDGDGNISGSNNRFFTPISSASATYYAALENNSTGCLSTNAVAVKQIQDSIPTANADIDNDNSNNITCSADFTLQANIPRIKEFGTWTGPAEVTFSDINDPAATVNNLPVGKSTLRWTVNSAYEVCSDAFDEIKVERFALPTVIDPTPELCTDSSGTELVVKGIDLSADYKDLITGINGSADLEVTWFSDQERTVPLADPTDYTANNSTAKIVYTRVTHRITSCFNDGKLTFTVNALPEAIDLTDTMCEDALNGNEVANVDLTNYNSAMIGSASASDRTVEWFSDASYMIAVPDPSNVAVSNNEIFYGRVTDTKNPSLCTNDAELVFTINPLPEDNPITGPTMQCAGSNIQLYQIEPTLGSTYSWHIPAEFAVFAGGGPDDFFILLNFPDTATADLEVTETSADGCVGNVQKLTIQVVSSPPPLTISPANPEVCENEAGVVFSVDNLPNTTYAWSVPSGASIINGQGTNQVTVNFGLFGGNVSVVPTGTTGNCAGTSAKTSVTMNQRPQMDSDLDNTVCSGEISAISLSYLASGTPATGYDIIDISVDPGLVSDDSNAVIGADQPADAIFNDIYTNQKGGQLSVRYIVQPRSSKGCLGPATVISLEINPEPRLSASLNKEKCSGEASDIFLSVATGSFPANSYNILSVNTGGLIPDTLNNTYSGTFPYNDVAANFLQNEKYRNYSSNPLEVVYEVVPVSSGCAGKAAFVVLTVNPEPVGTHVAEDAICSGETLNLTLQENINMNNAIESSFTWTASYGTALKGGISAGSGNISETLTNTGSSQQNAIYTVTPSSATTACTGAIFTITVPVNPEIQANDQNVSICSNETIIDLTALDSAITAGIDNQVSWFSDASATVEITNPKEYDVKKDINSVYAVVTEGICSRIAKVSFTLTEIVVSTIGVTSDFNGYDVSCIGASDATVKFQASGGMAPYNFILNEDPSNTTGASTGEFSGLPAGSYSVTVTDASGCSSDAAEPAIVSDPLPLNAGTVFGTSNICEGNLPSTFIQVNKPSGGTGNYSYQWEVSTDSISFTNANGVTANNVEYDAVIEDFSNGEGAYYFRRLVSSGSSAQCLNVSSNIIKVIINPLPTGDFTFKDTNGNSITEICAGDPFLIDFTFTNGASQYSFDYHDDKGNVYTNNFGTSTTSVLVNFDKVTSTTTFTLDIVRDMYGCKIDTALNVSHTINVINTDAEFTVIGPRENCSPAAIEFNYNQVSGVTYTWRWFDGTADSTYTATTTEADKRITHTFNNGSPTTTINYEVSLFASDTSASGTICESYTHEKVTVYPKVQANVFAQNPVVCSDDEIRFINLSLGASNHKWFYREAGNEGQEEQVQTNKNASFNIVNTGPDNPQVYEVVYTGSAEQDGKNTCADTQIILIEVYKKATPDFTFTPDPPSYENGAASVLFTNTSVPNNDTVNFSYNWDFDDGLKKKNIANPGTVTYTQPGQKTIILTIVNNAFPGLCDVSVTKTINIQNLAISADFRVENEDLCRNTDVIITNESTGEANEFTWEIFDENEVLVHKHINVISPEEAKLNPSFSYNAGRAGVYNVHLTARNTYSNDTQKVVKTGAFEVYELPIANFDTRPDIVFIPDQPLITYNLSNDADSYSWDFGDGSPVSAEYEPEHYYREEGTFNVTLVASAIYPGITCSDTISRQVIARSGGDVKLPNAFTPSPYGPSGDGRIRNEEANDIFLPVTKGVVEFHMVIFNRWGDMIFQSTDSTVGWDGYDRNGKLLPAGVYIYQLTLELSNGQRKQISGDVMLIK